MAMESTSDEELLSRADTLVKRYAALAPELADKLEVFGRLRNELQVLAVEIKERGLQFNDAQEV